MDTSSNHISDTGSISILENSISISAIGTSRQSNNTLVNKVLSSTPFPTKNGTPVQIRFVSGGKKKKKKLAKLKKEKANTNLTRSKIPCQFIQIFSEI